MFTETAKILLRLAIGEEQTAVVGPAKESDEGKEKEKLQDPNVQKPVQPDLFDRLVSNALKCRPVVDVSEFAVTKAKELTRSLSEHYFEELTEQVRMSDPSQPPTTLVETFRALLMHNVSHIQS